MFAKLVKFLMLPYTRYKEKKALKEKIKKLREKDPFIYE